MKNNEFDTENFFQKIDFLIEKWCRERGIKKKFFFDSGIITHTGYQKAMVNQSLRIKTLIDIANFFEKDWMDFFKTTGIDNQIMEPEVKYSTKTESELLFMLRDELRSLQKEVEKIKKMRL